MCFEQEESVTDRNTALLAPSCHSDRGPSTTWSCMWDIQNTQQFVELWTHLTGKFYKLLREAILRKKLHNSSQQAWYPQTLRVLSCYDKNKCVCRGRDGTVHLPTQGSGHESGTGEGLDLMTSRVAKGSGQGMSHHGAGHTGEQPQLIHTQ